MPVVAKQETWSLPKKHPNVSFFLVKFNFLNISKFIILYFNYFLLRFFKFYEERVQKKLDFSVFFLPLEELAKTPQTFEK